MATKTTKVDIKCRETWKVSEIIIKHLTKFATHALHISRAAGSISNLGAQHFQGTFFIEKETFTSRTLVHKKGANTAYEKDISFFARNLEGACAYSCAYFIFQLNVIVDSL